MNRYQAHIDLWTSVNAPVGKDLGYPDCCVHEFCQQPPIVLANSNVSKADQQRYQAGCIGEQFTGFIPCSKHADQILKGKIQLQDLISNRNPKYKVFPWA